MQINFTRHYWLYAFFLVSALCFGAKPAPGAPGPTAENAKPYSVRMADSVIARNSLRPPKWDYTYGVVYSGLEQVWRQTKDQKYFDYIKGGLDPLIDANGNIQSYKPTDYKLDDLNCGKLLFTLYRQDPQLKYKKALYALRAQLATQPRTSDGGFWHKKIYPHQMWLDGIYMGAPFYAEFGKTFHEPQDFDDAARQIIVIAQHTRDPKTGLFYHGWYQVLDQGNRPGNYLEASASCMFVYAAAKGVRMGYLDKSFLPMAQQGYHGIIHRLITVDKDGLLTLTQCNAVAGLGGSPHYRDGSFAYYISEPVVSNDNKAVGAFILASVEMEALPENLR
jgi:rhamnogalacturonyl hydrolase YesR